MTIPPLVFAASLVSMLLSPSVMASQDEQIDGYYKRCIPVGRIISYNLEDKKTVRFVTRGIKHNLDVLAHMKVDCPEIEHEINLQFTSKNSGYVCARFDSIVIDQFRRCRINNFTFVPKVGSAAEKEKVKREEAEK